MGIARAARKDAFSTLCAEYCYVRVDRKRAPGCDTLLLPAYPKGTLLIPWIIDAKDRAKITDWEQWWSLVIKPWLQSHFLREKFGVLTEGDYSHFARYDMAVPKYLKPYLSDSTAKSGINIGKLLGERFRFSSTAEPGLELIDILANATRRALNGNLQVNGWRNIPRTMIHRGTHYINLLCLGEPPPQRTYPYMKVLNHFRRNGKDMLIAHHLRQ